MPRRFPQRRIVDESWTNSAIVQRSSLFPENWTPGQQLALLSLHSEERTKTVVAWLQANSTAVITQADFMFLISQGCAYKEHGRFNLLTPFGVSEVYRLVPIIVKTLGIHAFWETDGYSHTRSYCVCGWGASHSKNQGHCTSQAIVAQNRHLQLVAEGKWPPKDSFAEIDRRMREDYERRQQNAR